MSVRNRSKSSVEALGRLLSNIDWSVLNSLSTIEYQLNYFSDMIMIGLNSLTPSKVIKLHVDDTPWMSPYLKDLIRKRQTALKENNTLLFKFYRNRVNREEKQPDQNIIKARSIIYETLIQRNGGCSAKRFVACQKQTQVLLINYWNRNRHVPTLKLNWK